MRDDEGKKGIWDCFRIANESPVCEKKCHNAGVWGSIFYFAGHGKLFIADVDGTSASNEIPRFLFCKHRLSGPVRFSVEGLEMFPTYVPLVRTLFGEGSKDSA